MKKIMIIISILIILIIWFNNYFFRRQKPIYYSNNNSIIYSPAYGRILKIFNINEYLCISIFLSPLDIHRQYIPINGIIKSVKYDNTGKFNLAYEETKSRMNEKCITQLLTKYGIIYIYQIAGFFVRRIVNDLEINKKVITGEDMGIIKWGSRVDILIPNRDDFMINVKEGDIVKGTYSQLGRFTKKNYMNINNE